MWDCELVTSGGQVNFGICLKQRLGIWNRLGFMSQVNWLKSLPLDGVLTWSFLGNKMKSVLFDLRCDNSVY